MTNYQTNPTGPALIVPTLADIQNLQVGDLALDCFGKMRRVIDIRFRGTDVYGRAFVGFTTEFGENSGISHSLKENELARTVATSNAHASAELDAIERSILADRPALRG
jgi:hypothetical protein